jgi:acetyl esterase/lipase
MQIDLWNGHDAPGADSAPGAPAPRLTAYATSTPVLRGAVIVLPGGGYVNHAAHESEPVARWIAGLGLAAFVLRYRVAPFRHPWPLADAQRAIRVVRSRSAEWGIDPSKIGILGFSAGGHLAVSAGTLHALSCYEPLDAADATSARPDFVIACYPVVTFGPYRHSGSMVSLLGENPDPALRRLLSLEESVDERTAPTFIWHTANDQGVPVDNSLLLASSLSLHKVPFELHVFPDGRHGLGLAADRPEVGVWTELAARWIVGRCGGAA